ncbi:MAG: MBL fold metallo-hydrolase [Lachnospiraceae bacterium]
MGVKSLLLGAVRTNCHIVYEPETKKAVIIDPADDAERIERVIKELEIVPEGILLTHGHFDHMLAAADLRQHYRIPVGCLEAEQEVLEDSWKNVSSRFMLPYGMEADEYYEDGQVLPYLNGELLVIATPGHTVGSCCYYWQKERKLFAGDTLFYESIGRTDLPTGKASAIQTSIKEKLFVLPDRVEVYPGHGQNTTIRHEKEFNSQILRDDNDLY